MTDLIGIATGGAAFLVGKLFRPGPTAPVPMRGAD